MLIALEGIAGAGKSALRDWLLDALASSGIAAGHVGQFSWLSLPATRTLVRLRSGDPAGGAAVALEAARTDLALHAQYNISPAKAHGPVIADRLSLSTAALLAFVHGGPVAWYVTGLACVHEARPDLIIVLTTPPGTCHDRTSGRDTAPRFGEDPGSAIRLGGLLAEAAAAWADVTGLRVIMHPSTTADDLAELGATCLARFAVPALRATEAET